MINDYFGIDDSGIMFACEACDEVKFVHRDDIDDQELFEMAVNDEPFICGTCADVLMRGN